MIYADLLPGDVIVTGRFHAMIVHVKRLDSRFLEIAWLTNNGSATGERDGRTFVCGVYDAARQVAPLWHLIRRGERSG